MSSELWQRVEELFEKAAELPPSDRSAFLDETTGGEPELRQEVESLLAADESAEQFMEDPVVPGGRLSDLLEKAGTHGPKAVEGRIGAYRLLRELGEGGMSRVYLAVRDDDQFQKLVAIKVIRAEQQGKNLLHRFRTERQILAGLDHPYIAKLLDGGSTEEDLPYFVMDYIEGVPLDEYCDKHQLTIAQRIEIVLKVCSAVEYAHRNLVVHRDLKATNILVTDDGVPKLLDFGIAKLMKPEQFALPLDITSPNVRPLTPYYASPEQVEGSAITTATDVYSLGVLLYRLLTGRFPYRFETRSVKDIEQVVLHQRPGTPSDAIERDAGDEAGTAEPDLVAENRATKLPRLRRQLEGDLDNILLMALRKEPQRRYASVEQFSEDLRRHLSGEPVVAHKDSVRYRVGKFLSRNRYATGVAAAFLVLLVSFSIAVSFQATKAAQERDQAQLERDRAENVVRFLQGIFQVSDPNQGGGATITAREILDVGAERVEQELSGQPEVRATLMEAIGNVYRNLGLYDSAEPLLQKALSTRVEVLGADHPAVAQSLNNLAIVLRAKGNFNGAEPLFRRALGLRKRILGDRHPDVAQSLYNLGRLLRETGKYDEAADLYEGAVSIYRQSSDDHSEDLTALIMDFGILRTQVGDFAGAEPLFREALDLRRAAYPEGHILVAGAANDLGVLMGMQGKLDESEPLFREALRIQRDVLPGDHPEIADTLNNLAQLLRRRRDYEEAESLFRQGLASSIRTRGRDHPLVATFTSNLAVLLQLMGEYPEAEALHRDALDIRRKVLGDDHHEVAISLKNLGEVLLQRNNPMDAVEYLRQSVSVFMGALPPNHWRTGEAKSLLGHCLGQIGESGEAEKLLVDGFEAIRLSLGAEHRRGQEALRRLVGFYEGLGRVTEANTYREQVQE